MVPWASNDVQKVFQMSSNSGVDWNTAAKVLSRADAKSAKGLVALTQTELELKGTVPLEAEKLSMAAFATSRSLAVETWVSLATTRAGVTDPAVRRAVGVVFSSAAIEGKKSEADRNAFSAVARAMRAGAAGSPAGSIDCWKMLAALEAEVREVVASLTEEDFARASKPARQGYDGAVTVATFEWIAEAAEDALRALPPSPGGATVLPLLLPALREAQAQDEDELLDLEAMVKGGAKALAGGKGFGAAAAKGFAQAALTAVQKLPDFGALIRKGGRFSFPELAGWPLQDESAVVEGAEAVAMFMDLVLRLHASQPAGTVTHVLLPGGFMARTLAFGFPALAPGLTLGSAADPPPANATLLLVAAFHPTPKDAVVAAAVTSAARVVTVAIGRCGRAEDRKEATKALLAATEARALTKAV